LDEAFAFTIMREYEKMPTKEERNNDNLVGGRLEDVMEFFNDMMTKI